MTESVIAESPLTEADAPVASRVTPRKVGTTRAARTPAWAASTICLAAASR